MGLPLKKKSLPTQRNVANEGKAKEILHDGAVRGKPITTKQRGLMAIIATGVMPKKVKK